MVYLVALIFLILFIGAAAVQKAVLALVAILGLALALTYISISTGLSAWTIRVGSGWDYHRHTGHSHRRVVFH